jgi:hypothetical protein
MSQIFLYISIQNFSDKKMSNDTMTQIFYTRLTQNIFYEQEEKNYILITKLSLCRNCVKILCHDIISLKKIDIIIKMKRILILSPPLL